MNNKLKENAGKFHLFLSLYEDQTITVENYIIKSRGVEELIRVAIDSNLNLKSISCLYASRQIVNFMFYLAFLNK